MTLAGAPVNLVCCFVLYGQNAETLCDTTLSVNLSCQLANRSSWEPMQCMLG